MKPPPLTTAELRKRILSYAAASIQAGLISEQRLAKLAGYSQPHIHNVLAAVRTGRPQLVDAIARALQITVLDLYTLEEIHAMVDDSRLQLATRDEIERDMIARVQIRVQ